MVLEWFRLVSPATCLTRLKPTLNLFSSTLLFVIATFVVVVVDEGVVEGVDAGVAIVVMLLGVASPKEISSKFGTLTFCENDEKLGHFQQFKIFIVY